MIELKNIHISFQEELFHDASLVIPDQSITVIAGRSGLGKSTILNHIAFLNPQWKLNLRYYLDGKELNYKSDADILALYRQQFFYIFQKSNMMDEMSCYDNILFLCSLYGIQTTKEQIHQICDLVNLDIDLDQYPNTISGGQRQKLEIAMIMILKPRYILCDEITSALDKKSAIEIFDMLKDIVHSIGASLIAVSHDQHIIDMCDRLYVIEDKQMVLKRDVANDETKYLSREVHKTNYRKDFLRFKLHNQEFIKQFMIMSVLLSILITSFNILWKYNLQSKKEFSESLLSDMNNEIMFNTFSMIEGDPYYSYTGNIVFNEQEYENVGIHIGNIQQGLHKHIISETSDGVLYVNEKLAQKLGLSLTTYFDNVQFIIDGKSYDLKIKGVIDDSYHTSEGGYEIYYPDASYQKEGSTVSTYCNDDPDEMEKVIKELKSLGITTYGKIDDYEKVNVQNNSVKRFMNILLIVLGFIFVAFSILYGIIRSIIKEKECNLLLRRGLSRLNIIRINLYENLPIIIISISSSLVLTLAGFYLFSRNRLVAFQLDIVNVMMSTLIFELIFIFIVQIMILFIMSKKK